MPRGAQHPRPRPLASRVAPEVSRPRPGLGPKEKVWFSGLPSTTQRLQLEWFAVTTLTAAQGLAINGQARERAGFLLDQPLPHHLGEETGFEVDQDAPEGRVAGRATLASWSASASGRRA